MGLKMNTRILELAKQAGLKFPSESALSPSEQKFVVLLIQECIEQIDINNYNSGDEWDAAMTCASNVIKEHFGLAK